MCNSADDRCCTGDPDECVFGDVDDDSDDAPVSTVEGELLKKACDEAIETIVRIKELVDEQGDEREINACCISLIIEVGTLTQQVAEYMEPL